LLRLSHFIDAFTGRVGIVAYWLLPLMVLVGTWNVFGRYFGQWIGTNLTSNVLLEMQWYIFSLLFLLGAPYALLHNEHVRVDVLYARLSKKKHAMINLVGTVLFLIPFCIIVMYFSWSFVVASWEIFEDSPDPGGLPRYPIKTMIPVGMMLLMVQAFSEIIKNTARLTGTLPLEEESEHEQHDDSQEWMGDFLSPAEQHEPPRQDTSSQQEISGDQESVEQQEQS
jgi:TRAP-type mannitol/chloroaromatic compound transport system permease small subunit